MRIGVISDIHGNLPALEAVRRDLERWKVDQLINLGDLAFRGPFPSESVQMVRTMGAPVILGNTELFLTGDGAGLPPLGQTLREWGRSRLTDEELAYLAALPGEVRMEVGGQRLLFVHGSPRSHSELLYPFTTDADLSQALEGCAADVVICGHTHWTYSRRIGAVQLIGVGSVGLPFDGDRRPAYAVLDVTDSQVTLSHVRMEYDGQSTLALAGERGFPDMDFLRSVVQHGRVPS